MFPAWETEVGIVPRDAGFVSAGEHNARGVLDPDEILPMLDTRFNGERNLAFIRTGASWRRMLVSQPPPVKVVRLDRFHAKEFEWKVVEFKEGLRMGVLFDEVFAMNWTLNRRCLARGCKFNCHGEPAFITWRVPKEVVKERPAEETLRWLRESWEEDARPPEWLKDCDLVLGEDGWHRMGTTRCWHPWPDGMGPRCFMWQQGLNFNSHRRWTTRKRYTSVCGKSMKWLFQCKEYKPGGPLSLPPVKREKKK
ncbi:hypothetical protein QBC34DRAFT_419367 [Podospora aff. communis PSN243]|uniref:Uncharacterized protein n=1 Tax=Podospora aff. communis PSN243 TaxID=3040156 RepID=A0AAV9G0S0_9PEZI|nr:hypothetical protein QBC34DRAFT_419367 [Podospora aff. communis PSN243]